MRQRIALYRHDRDEGLCGGVAIKTLHGVVALDPQDLIGIIEDAPAFGERLILIELHVSFLSVAQTQALIVSGCVQICSAKVEMSCQGGIHPGGFSNDIVDLIAAQVCSQASLRVL